MRPDLDHVVLAERDQAIEAVLVQLRDLLPMSEALANDHAHVLRVLHPHHKLLIVQSSVTKA